MRRAHVARGQVVGVRVARVVAALAVTAAAGCSIRPDSSPRDVTADKERGLQTPEPETPGDVATGDDRVFLVPPSDPDQLRAVARETDGSPADLLQTLLNGPNETERGEGYASAIPESVELNSVTVRGDVIDVDLGDGLDELPEAQLVTAVGQIVYTASQLVDGAGQVLIRVDGDAQSWPDAAGQEQSRPLTVYDFYGMVESSQPAYPQHSPQ